MKNEDEPVGTVMIDTDLQPICFPDHASITVSDKHQKLITYSCIC